METEDCVTAWRQNKMKLETLLSLFESWVLVGFSKLRVTIEELAKIVLHDD